MSLRYKKIQSKNFNYSHIGEASAKKYLYLIDKKKHLNNLLKGKKRNKIVEADFIDQEEKDIYDELYEKDEYEEDIFDKDYKNKYKQLLEEQKQKYFNLKNSCSFLDSSNKKKEKENKEEDNKKMRILNRFDNNKYKYHLIHHHHDHYVDKSLLKANEAEPACTSYNPKMEYIYKKIIYSPEFKKMSGRYDQENLKDKIEHQMEINIKQKKEKESRNYQKKLDKIRTSIIIPKENKEINLKNNIVDFSIRHKSVSGNIGENRKNSLISLIKTNKDNIANDNNDELINNESRNFNRKLFKRTNTMFNKDPQALPFGFGNNKSNKNSFDIKNIEEDNEEDNYDFYDNRNQSNNIDGNTVSSANHNKTTSGKKKDSSVNYINNETDIIYSYNLSKNDSNILINNNYSYKKDKEGKKNKRNDFNNNINNENSINKKRINNKNNHININNNNKQILLPSLNNNKVVNFDKMLSRDYIRKLNEKKGNIYSSLSPNYDSIRPKCIMKVIYAQKHYRKNKKNEFKSTFNEFVYDINKIFNNYNNHLPPKDINLDKMTGRELNDNTPLPSYMINQYNRNAFNTFNDKSLEMNNFANGQLKQLKSSFNDKKSFNYKLNDQYFDNNNIFTEEITSLMKKISRKPINNKKYEYKECKSISCSKKIDQNYGVNTSFKAKMPEYYKVNLDKLGKYRFSNGEKIDGFTLKTIKNNKSAIDLLNNKEKKIFLSKLDE